MFFHPTTKPNTNGRTRLLGHWYIPYVCTCVLVKCYIVRTPSDVLVFLLQSILFFEPQQQPTATERPTHCSVATKEPWRALVPSAYSAFATSYIWPRFPCRCSVSSVAPWTLLCLIIELSPSLPIVIFGSCQSSG